MPCPDQETLCAFTDASLSPAEIGEVSAHLAQCRTCCEFVEEMRQVDALGRAALEKVPVASQPSLRIEKVASPTLFRRIWPALAAAAVLVFFSGILVDRTRRRSAPPAS